MAKVFLDTNIFIDLVENRREINIELTNKEKLFLSPLSVHVLFYIARYKTPSHSFSVENLEEFFSLISFDDSICIKALQGPTSDFEDNVQLHSAAIAECDVFLTEDKKLLEMKFFGKVKIIDSN